jgi:hypothetical protein
MTPVENQGNCGGCVAFAVVGAIEAQFKITYNNPSWNIDLSEQALFSCGGGTCNGGWAVPLALNQSENVGIPDAACYPDLLADGLDHPCSSECADWQSRSFKIRSWNWVFGGTFGVELSVLSGPLIAVLPIYYDFEPFFLLNPTGVYHWDHVSPLLGYHAVVIMGYDSAQQYWIVKNSWGSDWGDNGYFKIGWDEPAPRPIETEVYSVVAGSLPNTYVRVNFGPVEYKSTPPSAYIFQVSAQTSPDLWITSLHWDFGDGSTMDVPFSGQSQVSDMQYHSYTTAGEYIVRVTAQDNAGNNSTGSILLAVVPEFPSAPVTLAATLFVALIGLATIRRRHAPSSH